MYNLSGRIRLLLLLLMLTRLIFSQPVKSVQVTLLHHDSVKLVRYARSIQDLNGDIYVQGGLKVALNKNGDAVVSSLTKDYFPKQAVDDGAIHNFYGLPLILPLMGTGAHIQLFSKLNPVYSFTRRGRIFTKLSLNGNFKALQP